MKFLPNSVAFQIFHDPYKSCCIDGNYGTTHKRQLYRKNIDVPEIGQKGENINKVI